jgi:hypothetical protein
MKFLKTIIADNRVVIRNIMLGLYYLMIHFFLSEQSFDGRLILPFWAACCVIFLLLIEPISIRIIAGNAVFKSKKASPRFHIGIISGSFIAVARIVFRLLFLLAALPALFPTYHFDHPATIYILAVLFINELMTLHALARPKSLQVSSLAANLHQFVLWNISFLFLFIFDESLMRHIFNDDMGQGNSKGMMIFYSAFLLFIFYLPNRIIDVYSEWMDLKGNGAKAKYILSVLYLYVLMLVTQ